MRSQVTPYMSLGWMLKLQERQVRYIESLFSWYSEKYINLNKRNRKWYSEEIDFGADNPHL